MPFAPAVLICSPRIIMSPKKKTPQKTTPGHKLFERYAALMPQDPRPHEVLAFFIVKNREAARAEAEYRPGDKARPATTRMPIRTLRNILAYSTATVKPSPR